MASSFDASGSYRGKTWPSWRSSYTQIPPFADNQNVRDWRVSQFLRGRPEQDLVDVDVFRLTH
jgi:hypothetical protein